MHQAIGHCRARGAHVCEHNEFQEICGHGYNPYYGDGGTGRYGDHGTASGSNWDDKYGAWNGGSCANNNDDPAYHYRLWTRIWAPCPPNSSAEWTPART